MPVSLPYKKWMGQQVDHLELTPSFNGKTLVVSYSVRFTLRHEGWLESKRGKLVELPVWVSQPPQNLE